MSNLLREYIKSILLTQKLYEAKSKGGLDTPDTPEAAALLSNKVLGYAAEWAVYAALGGTEDMLSTDKRIKGRHNDGPYPHAGRPAQEEFLKIYGQMMDAVGREIKKKKLKLGYVGDAPGAGTQKVDVMSTLADIHIKYNDFKRLVGFQKDKEESDKDKEESDKDKEESDIELPIKKGETQKITPEKFQNTSSVYDAGLTQFFQEIRTEGNVIYKKLSDESQRVLMTRKLRTRHHSGARLSGRRVAKSFPRGEKSDEYQKFLKYRTAYQEAVKIVGRDRFYEILEEKRFKEALLRDIEQLLFVSANKIKNTKGKEVVSKKIYFAKFSGPNIDSLGSGVTCEFYDYSKILKLGTGGLIEKMDVVEYRGRQLEQNVDAVADAALGEKDGVSAATTVFYQVVDRETRTVYFDIEFRLDGDSHPPQLKATSGITALGSGGAKK